MRSQHGLDLLQHPGGRLDRTPNLVVVFRLDDRGTGHGRDEGPMPGDPAAIGDAERRVFEFTRHQRLKKIRAAGKHR